VAGALSELVKVIEVSGTQSIQGVYKEHFDVQGHFGLSLQASSDGYQSICFVTRHQPGDLMGKQPISMKP